MKQKLSKLSKEKEDLDKAQVVCKNMYQDGTEYESLDAEKYLQNLKHFEKVYTTYREESKFSWDTYWDTREAYEDTLPKVQAPWRRFFARIMDEAFYSTIWSTFMIVVLDVNLMNRGSRANFVDIIMLLLLTIVLEPIQLTLFGTTLGKWILGISILHNDDRKLTFSEAFERTGQVLFYGLGFHIPIYNWVRMWKSYKACMEREHIVWEYDSRIILKDEQNYRAAIYLAVRVLFIGILVLANALAQKPVHCGTLSIPQFCQNYRVLEKYYGLGTGYILNSDGTWRTTSSGDGHVVIYLFGAQDPPSFEFKLDDDGKIQEISFTLERYSPRETPKDDRPWIASYQNQMQLAVLSFVGARDEFPKFSNAKSKMLKQITSHVFEDYSFTEAGVTVTCDVEYKGYSPVMGLDNLIPAEEGECTYYMKFTMAIEE